jgi:aryl-alcohol dehydrogenase-like predicted oxidoreductase
MAEQQQQQRKLKYRNLGSTGLKVSEICLGTMTFGPSGWNMPTTDEETSFKIMDRFAEYGGNFLDTADIYGPFHSEQIVGNWLKTKKREDFVIATKFRNQVGPGPNDTGASRKHIMAAVEESLKRLQTDYIDLYQIHAWDASTPLKETLTTLNDLVRSGKVRYIGASNYNGWQLQKALDLSQHIGLEPYISLQQQYSLLERNSEHEAFEVCKQEGVGILPWSPLKGGLLSGKFTRQRDVTADPNSRVAWAEKVGWSATNFSRWNSDFTWNVIDKIEEIGKQVNKTVAQVSLRWLLHKPAVSSVIIGAKTVQQLEENIEAGLFTLTDAQVAALDEVSTRPMEYPYDMIHALNNTTNFGMKTE